LKRWKKLRHQTWVRALIVGVLLAGEIHVYSAEIFHDHNGGVASVGQFERKGATSLQAAQELTPLCPLCQIVRSSSVRPAVQSVIQRPHRESTFQPLARRARISSNFTPSLLARGPPLS